MPKKTGISKSKRAHQKFRYSVNWAGNVVPIMRLWCEEWVRGGSFGEFVEMLRTANYLCSV